MAALTAGGLPSNFTGLCSARAAVPRYSGAQNQTSEPAGQRAVRVRSVRRRAGSSYTEAPSRRSCRAKAESPEGPAGRGEGRTVTSGGTGTVVAVTVARGGASCRTGPVGSERIRVPTENRASVTGLSRVTGCRPLA